MPINGRLTTLLPFRHPRSTTGDYLFFTTDRKQFGIVGYDPSADGADSLSLDSPYRIFNHAHGPLADYGASVLGRESEAGPLAAIDPAGRCIAVHLYDGFVTILPLNPNYDPRACLAAAAAASASSRGGTTTTTNSSGRDGGKVPASALRGSASHLLGSPFNVRIEERTVLSLAFLHVADARVMPQLGLLHQDAKRNQHVIAHSIDLSRRTMVPQSDAGAGGGGGGGGGGSGSAGRAGQKQQQQARTASAVPPNSALVVPPHAERLRKSKVDGGSGLVVAVPPCSTAGASYAVPRVPGAGVTSRAVLGGNGGGDKMEDGGDDEDDDGGDSKMPAKPSATGGGGGGGALFPPASGTSGMGGVLIFGQTQITYANTAEGPAKTLPMAQALVLAVDPILLDDDDAAGSASGGADKSGGGGGDEAVVAAGRYLLATENGSIHLLTILRSSKSGKVSSLHLETLGPAPALASTVTYLSNGLVFVGSAMGDSALLRILDEPVAIGGGGAAAPVDESMLHPTTYLSTVEEYTNLGPIVDFDVIPKDSSSSSSSEDKSSSAALTRKNHRQCMVVTASGVGTSGTVRLVRSGIGLTESASINLPGIKGMWNLRAKFGDDAEDTYLVQSYVGETRVLGVVSAEDDDDDEDEEEASMETDGASQDASQDDASQDASQESDDEDDEEENGATLAEVLIPGFDSNHSTLFAGNICPIPLDDAAPAGSDTLAVQVTDSEVRLVNLTSVAMDEEGSDASEEAGHSLLDIYRPESEITVAAGNDAGQIILALRGGLVLYLDTVFTDGAFKLNCVAQKTLEREISCLDVRAFDQTSSSDGGLSGDIDEEASSMEVDGATKSPQAAVKRSNLVAVGLWDDFTVRLLSLNDLGEVLHINLGTDQDANPSSAAMDVESSGGADDDGANGTSGGSGKGQHMMARSLCMVTLGSGGGQSQSAGSTSGSSARSQASGVDVLLVGLGDGGLVSFAVSSTTSDGTASAESKETYSVYARKEVNLGTRAVGLVPFRASTLLQGSDSSGDKPEKGSTSGSAGDGTCVLATGDRPTVVYLAGTNSANARAGSGTIIPKLCYSSVHLSSDPSSADEEEEDQQTGSPNAGGAGRESLTVTVAAPFHSSLLVSSAVSGGTGDGADQKDSSLTYPLCVADESTLRLGIIDDIQKLHVTTHKLGMTPRRVAYHEAGRVICVGAIDGNSSSTKGGDGGMMQGESNMGNCVRFFDDTTLEEVDRLDLDPFEMILSMVSATLTAGQGESAAGEGDGSKRRVSRPYVIIGTAYAYPDEDEPTKGRVLLIQCGGGGSGDGNAAGDDSPMVDAAAEGGPMPSALNRTVRIASELIMKGGVYSICPFYDGSLLVTENSKTRYCRVIDGSLKVVGAGHHGHTLSLCVQSLVPPHSASGPSTLDDERSQLAIVGDLMRSVAVVQYFPKYKALEEVARDYNTQWTTATEMLTENVYLVAENWCNFVILKRNPKAAAEEVRCRLETVGEFNAGEMANKLMSGSLVVPTTSSENVYDSRGALCSGDASPGGFTGMRSPKKAKKAAAANSNTPMKAVVTIGSRTLYCTVDGSIGSCLGLDVPTAAFFCALERCMARAIRPVGGLGHSEFRAFVAEKRHHPSRGFVDGDFIESFLDLDRTTMERIVAEMNEDGLWETEDLLDSGSIPSGNSSSGRPKDQKTILMVEDVLGMVEEISMSH